MSRKEFMERLEKLLWNISDSEREEALQYYNDYFDDAGEENEAEVIRELVSPEQVAQKIKAGLSDSASEFSEQGIGIPGSSRGTRSCPPDRAAARTPDLAGTDRGSRKPGKRRRISGRCWPSCCSAFWWRRSSFPWHRTAGGGPLPGGRPSGAGRRNRGVRNRGSDFRNFRHRRGSCPGLRDAGSGDRAGRHGLHSGRAGTAAFRCHPLVLR